MKKLPLCSLFTATLLCWAGPQARAGEAVPLENPGFEKQLDGWLAHADGDKSHVVAEAAHGGKLGLRVTDESDADGCMIESAKFPCKGGKTYELTFWSRLIAGEGAAVYLKYYDAGGQEITPDTTVIVPADTAQWKQFSLKAKTPPNTAKIMVWIHTGNAAKVTVDFDDLALRAID